MATSHSMLLDNPGMAAKCSQCVSSFAHCWHAHMQVNSYLDFCCDVLPVILHRADDTASHDTVLPCPALYCR